MKNLIILFFCFCCAITAFAQTNSSSEADIFYEKTKVIQQAGDVEKLLPAAEEMTKRWPQDARGWNFLGIYHGQKEHIEEAKAFYKRAIELNPKYSAPWANLGRLYSIAGDNERAITDFKESLRLKADYNLWLRLGMEQIKVKNFAQAIESFREATKLKPADEDGRLLFGNTLFEQEHFDETVSAMNQALKIMPKNENFHMLLINAYRKSGRFTEMMSASMELAKINPTNEIAKTLSKMKEDKHRREVIKPNQEELPKTISFTNKTGTVISNAEIIKVEPSKIIYRTGPSVFDSVKFVDLPDEVQKRFGYNPEKSAAGEQSEERQRAASMERQRKIIAQSKIEQQARERRAKVEKAKVLVWARVIQRLDDELLVDASRSGYKELTEFKNFAGKNADEFWKLARATGTILLTDYPRVKNVVDGDDFLTVAYAAGTYEYTTVNNSKKTIRKYTCDPDKAILDE